MRLVLTFVLAVSCDLGMSAVYAQTTPAASKSQTVVTLDHSSIPLSHLYFHFLKYQHHLDEKAKRYDKAGKPSAWLKDHFKGQLGFSEAEFKPIRVAAAQLSDALATLDDQAKPIVTRDRAYRKTQHIAFSVTTADSTQLHGLTEQRRALIEGTITSLDKALGPARTAKLDGYLSKDYSQRVQAKAIHLNPAKQHQSRLVNAKGGAQ